MHNQRPKRNDQGFSFVELVMMLAIVGVMSALSIPMLNSTLQDMQLSADAKSIVTTLTYARVSAASELTRCRILFDLPANRWNLSKRNRNTGLYEIQNAVNTLSDGALNSGIQFRTSFSTAPSGFPTISTNTITFDSRGIPMEGGGIVYLADRRVVFAVSISPSGKVQLWRFRNNQWIQS